MMVAAAFGAVTSVSLANPSGAKVVNGSASITNSGSTLVIKNTPGAIINWQSFSIGAGETTNFIQQSVNSAVLNRVVGVDPSVILGTLTSNGHVYLVNPNGVVFGKGAMVDAAGLVVSSLDITDEDFKNGTLRFVGSDASGSISVAGVLRSSDGDVYLIAPNITNSGSITAVNGNVTLAAGQDVEILGNGLTDIQFNVQNKGNSAVNLGQINGDAVGIFAGTITQAGGVNATTATLQGGRVILSALSDVTLAAGSSTSADDAGGSGGSITVQSLGGNISMASGASVSASGASGGSITLLSGGGADSITGSVAASGTLGLGGAVDVLGASVALNSGAAVDASGATGGGQISIGGAPKQSAILNASSTSVAAGAAISANANGSGDGGHVVVYGTSAMSMLGSVSAMGGTAGGNGGLVETSAESIDVQGSVTAAARSAKGKPGEWLLDPNNVTIDNNIGAVFPPSSDVSANQIAAALNNDTSVVVSTTAVGGAVANASITVNAAINANAVTGTPTLTLSAGGNITVNAGITGVGAAAGDALTLVMNANSDGNGVGQIALNAPILMPAGTLSMNGVGFANSAGNTITAGTINGTFAGAGTYNNLGTFDASGGSNNVSAGGDITIHVSTTVNTPIVMGSMLSDGNNSEGGHGGDILFSAIGAPLAMGVTANLISATGGTTNTANDPFGGTINLSSDVGMSLVGGTIIASGGAGAAGSGRDAGEGGSVLLQGGNGTASLNGVTVVASGGAGGSITLAGSGGSGGEGGSIFVQGQSVTITGGTLTARGGLGGSVLGANPGTVNGGLGGSGGSITISGQSNLGQVTLTNTTLDVSGGVGGASAVGGTGGTIVLNGSGTILTNNAILIASGGAGGAAIVATDGQPLTAGGDGGVAGSITLNGTGLTLNGGSMRAAGGVGGAGAPGKEIGVTAYSGTDGGDGGPGGLISISSQDIFLTSGSLATSGITVDVSGGAGGAGGSYTSTSGGTIFNMYGGNGGAGGTAGSISLYANGDMTLTNTVLTSSGGAGGAGGSLFGPDPFAVGGNGSNGGDGGTITLITDSFNATDGTHFDINLIGSTVQSVGGAGGAGGLSASNEGGGGSGGSGGNSALTNGTGAAINSISITAAGNITIDSTSVIKTAGGAGGDGASAVGVDPFDLAIGPGSGGNGGTAGTIFITTNTTGVADVTLNIGGTVQILGGNGGVGGNLSGTNITALGNPLVAGSGGFGGDAGYVDGNGALLITSPNGSVDVNDSAVIQIIAGNGGNGGLSNDFNFGPGNGGNGGNAHSVTMQSGSGDLTLNGSFTMSGGAGGNGGNSPNGATNSGGNGGNQGSTDLIAISAFNGNINIGANLEVDQGNPGNAGSGTNSDGVSGNQGNFVGSNVILLNANGSVEQTGGGITSSNSIADVNATALTGEVNLTAGSNQINLIQGTAYGGQFATFSNADMTVQSVEATNGQIVLAAPEVDVEGQVLSDANSVNLSASFLFVNNSVTGNNVNLTAANTYLNGNAQITASNDTSINFTTDSIYVVSGASITTSGYGSVQITTQSDGAPIFLTDSTYANGVVPYLNGTLILGREFFAALSTNVLNVGNTDTSSIALQSYDGNAGTIAIPSGTQLGLTGASISNDGLTQLAVDNLDVVSNGAVLTNLTSSSGGPLVLSGSALSSGTASLSVSLAPGAALQVGANSAGPDPDYGLNQYQSVSLFADSVRLTQYIEMGGGSSSQLTLGAVTPGTTLRLGGTAYSGWTLGTSDIDRIETDGSITIGGPNNAGSINVVGPADFFTNGTLLLQTTAGNISLVSGSLANSVGPLVLDAAGSISDPGGGSLSAETISLSAGSFIATPGAPMYVNATASTFGATANNGGIYVIGLGNLVIGAQGVVANGGDVAINAPNITNANQISGNNVQLGAGGFDNSGVVEASAGLLNISAVTVTSVGQLSGNTINLTGTSAITLENSVVASGDLTFAGGAIGITSAPATATAITADNITIDGQSLTVLGSGNTGAAYSTEIHAAGTLDATISGNVTVIGGGGDNGSAAIISGGNSTYKIGGDLNMTGGSANGAFALLDPTAPNSTMNISAAQINLTGGTAPGAYAAIVAEGNVILVAPQKITLTQGTAANSDGVVISRTGTITATTPDCENCTPETGTDPLTNTVTQTGFFGQAAAAPPPAAPPPAPPPAPAPNFNGVGDPANDSLIEDLITLWDTPLDAEKTTPIEGFIFVDGGVDGCL